MRCLVEGRVRCLVGGGVAGCDCPGKVRCTGSVRSAGLGEEPSMIASFLLPAGCTAVAAGWTAGRAGLTGKGRGTMGFGLLLGRSMTMAPAVTTVTACWKAAQGGGWVHV